MAYPTSPAPNDIDIVSEDYPQDVLKAEDQTPHTRLKLDKKLTTWKLEYQCISSTNLTTMIAYFDTQRGYYQSDTWVHPWDGLTKTIRIKQWSRRRAIGTTHFNLTVLLEEQP